MSARSTALLLSLALVLASSSCGAPPTDPTPSQPQLAVLIFSGMCRGGTEYVDASYYGTTGQTLIWESLTSLHKPGPDEPLDLTSVLEPVELSPYGGHVSMHFGSVLPREDPSAVQIASHRIFEEIADREGMRLRLTLNGEPKELTLLCEESLAGRHFYPEPPPIKPVTKTFELLVEGDVPEYGGYVLEYFVWTVASGYRSPGYSANRHEFCGHLLYEGVVIGQPPPTPAPMCELGGTYRLSVELYPGDILYYSLLRYGTPAGSPEGLLSRFELQVTDSTTTLTNEPDER